MCSWFKPEGFSAIPTQKSDLIQYWMKIIDVLPAHQISSTYVENSMMDIDGTYIKTINDDNDDDVNMDEDMTNADDIHNTGDVDVCVLGDDSL